MRLFNSKKKKLAAASIAAVGIIGAGAVAANAAGDTGCKYLTYPLCARSVASLQVVDGSLSESDLSPTVRTKLNKVGSGAAGPAGPAGPAGAAGAAGADGKDGAAGADGKDGAAGKDGVSGLSVGGATTVVPKGFSTLKLDCADGKKAIGGGLKWDSGTGSTASETVLNGSYPTDLTEVDGVSTATSWTIALTNNSPKGEVTVQPFVTCVTAS